MFMIIKILCVAIALFDVLFIYACAVVCGRNRIPYEDEEQMAYIKNWKEKHSNKE